MKQLLFPCGNSFPAIDTCRVVATATCSEKQSAAMFFKYNTQLGPPYQVLVDTNFINFSIKNKVSRGVWDEA